jgi:GNAT superfamily N-acetyltransferase
MPSSPLVRPVTRADYDQWLPLWDGYNAFYGRHGATALPRENTQMTWARFFDGYEPVHALVAESDGKLVGLTHYLFHRSTIMLGPICYLQDLFTDPALRGKGVGKLLIEAVYERARRAGSTRVYWHTQDTNSTARRLYDHVAADTGFVVYRKEL